MQMWQTYSFALMLSMFTASGVAGADTFEPIFRLKPEGAQQRFITQNQFEFEKLKGRIERVAFLAVCTNHWPAGMVPIFAIEKTNRFELRRRPPRGQENFVTPLFFALPPEDEPDAVKLAGHWDGTAERPGGSKDYPAFEFTVEGDQVVGRFDQNTEYRYAFISGGTFRSNRFELRVEYMNESWLLSGTWTRDMLKGTWRRADDSEQGPWEATRPPAVIPKRQALPLYEWRRASDDGRRYGFAAESFGTEWQRAARPLCRVWPSNK